MNGCSDTSIGVVRVQGGTACVLVVSKFSLLTGGGILECGEEAGAYLCRCEPLFLASSGRSEKF